MKHFAIPLLSALLLLTACGGSETSATNDTKAASSSASGLNAWGKSLVREDGCHPDIARAMQPFEADYGQCTMPTFEEVCGAGTFDAGVQLIAETFERDVEQVNPWGWACARSGNIENALTAGCMTRTRASEESCRCAARKTIASESAPIPELLSYTENQDMVTAKATYPDYLGVIGATTAADLTKENAEKQDQFMAAFTHHYERWEAECQ